MDSPQSVVSPFKDSPVFPEPERQKTNLFSPDPGCLSTGFEVQSRDTAGRHFAIGVLEVYIHGARDIHNICIYHKQDVYAKICLTSDPENAVSTQIINGGGKNPVFKEKLRLDVGTIDSSLKCEIWMLSRVRNYLEDQLLGFALVPLSEVLVKNGKLEEFSLSSTDLFHSPAGFVQLALSYSGASPEVVTLPADLAKSAKFPDLEVTRESISREFDEIEFLDLKMANENHMMVSEYFEIPCDTLASQNSQSLVSSETENQLSEEIGALVVQSFSAGTIESIELQKDDSQNSQTNDSPLSCVSTNRSPFASLPASTQSCDTPGVSKSPNEESVLPSKENLKEERDSRDAESNVSVGAAADRCTKPVVTVNNKPEPQVVQQDIVDMYMKSMQQFTESLAKMKLPMDFESGPPSSENSSSDQTLKASKTGSRVFYGSRAFF